MYGDKRSVPTALTIYFVYILPIMFGTHFVFSLMYTGLFSPCVIVVQSQLKNINPVLQML